MRISDWSSDGAIPISVRLPAARGAIIFGPMVRSVRLRRWQKQALDALDEAPGADFLAVAPPGAGKTTFALTAVTRHPAANPAHPAVVFAPTRHLQPQWSRAPPPFPRPPDPPPHPPP